MTGVKVVFGMVQGSLVGRGSLCCDPSQFSVWYKVTTSMPLPAYSPGLQPQAPKFFLSGCQISGLGGWQGGMAVPPNQQYPHVADTPVQSSRRTAEWSRIWLLRIMGQGQIGLN